MPWRRYRVVDEGGLELAGGSQKPSRVEMVTRLEVGRVAVDFPEAPTVTTLANTGAWRGHVRAHAVGAHGWYSVDLVSIVDAEAPTRPPLTDAIRAFSLWLRVLRGTLPGAYRRKMTAPTETAVGATLEIGCELEGRLIWRGPDLYALCATYIDPAGPGREIARRFVASGHQAPRPLAPLPS